MLKNFRINITVGEIGKSHESIVIRAKDYKTAARNYVNNHIGNRKKDIQFSVKEGNSIYYISFIDGKLNERKNAGLKTEKAINDYYISIFPIKLYKIKPYISTFISSSNLMKNYSELSFDLKDDSLKKQLLNELIESYREKIKRFICNNLVNLTDFTFYEIDFQNKNIDDGINRSINVFNELLFDKLYNIKLNSNKDNGLENSTKLIDSLTISKKRKWSG